MIYIINKSIIISFVDSHVAFRKKRTINIKEADLGFPYEMTYSSRFNALSSEKET